MIPTDAKAWTNEQIHLFSKWIQGRNHTVFFPIARIKRDLRKLNIPFFFIRVRQSNKALNIKNTKRTHLLALGTQEDYISIRLRKHPMPTIRAGGLWTHQLLITMVYANLIKSPATGIDVGAQPTLEFCLRVWDKFLDYKLSLVNLDK
jgi:hypothetical protein